MLPIDSNWYQRWWMTPRPPGLGLRLKKLLDGMAAAGGTRDEALFTHFPPL